MSQHVSSAESEIVIVAPFITNLGAQLVASALRLDVRVRVVTRWLPDELAAGVSDVDAFLAFSTFENCSFYLSDALHAKYYRADDRVLLGSANITGRALGLGSRSNLELLAQPLLSGSECAEFEQALFSSACQVTYDDYLEAKALQDELRALRGVNESVETQSLGPDCTWLPQLFDPVDLMHIYNGLDGDLAENDIRWGKATLTRWAIPSNLPEDSFWHAVKFSFAKEKFVVDIQDFLTPHERRFGEVRQFIRKYGDFQLEGTIEWQATMSWLLHLFPDAFTYRRNPHSELVQFVGPSKSSTS